jgi:hypothetical protein
MITLTTGLPGSGKTLFTIDSVKQLADKENRPVFYSGIKDLALPWHEIDAEKWMDCSEGAIIVIDECQRLFRPRGNGSLVPAYVSELETHRHKGFDIFLVTQHPMLMDANVRRLTERHNHVARRFGMQRATVLQFESCKEQPLSKQEGAQRLEWKYPKAVFEYYKSAEVHTVKRRIPMTLWVLLSLPLLVGGIIWYFVSSHYQDGKVVITKSPIPPGQTVDISGKQAAGGKDSAQHVRTPVEYLAAYTPRVAGLAYTASVYDEVTKPVRAPVPAGTVVARGKCKAYTDQGTPLAMDQALCMQFAANGFYREFDNKPVGKAIETRKDAPNVDKPVPYTQTVPNSVEAAVL